MLFSVDEVNTYKPESFWFLVERDLLSLIPHFDFDVFIKIREITKELGSDEFNVVIDKNLDRHLNYISYCRFIVGLMRDSASDEEISMLSDIEILIVLGENIVLKSVLRQYKVVTQSEIDSFTEKFQEIFSQIDILKNEVDIEESTFEGEIFDGNTVRKSSGIGLEIRPDDFNSDGFKLLADLRTCLKTSCSKIEKAHCHTIYVLEVIKSLLNSFAEFTTVFRGGK